MGGKRKGDHSGIRWQSQGFRFYTEQMGTHFEYNQFDCSFVSKTREVAEWPP